jgi:nitronate monooxygenase
MWRDKRILDLFGIELPIVLAPMAGPGLADLAIPVAQAGGLGSIPCALLTHDQARAEMEKFRAATSAPVNLNFFCHRPPRPNEEREMAWRERLKPYYEELGIDPATPIPVSNRAPFDDAFCKLVEELRPEVVSFHFGLPTDDLLLRVKAAGARVMASATTVREAIWLERHGADIVIAQGFEAGGHRGIFLDDHADQQVGAMALVPQIVDAVKIPVIAAGGIGDGRGIAAALALGASAAQIGTAYLFTPEAKVAPQHRAALKAAWDDETVLTRLFTGRPARGIVNRIMREVGPMSEFAPEFPLAGGALAPLRAKSEPVGMTDFMSLWSGQAMRLGREIPAGELTSLLADEAQKAIGRL